VLLQLLKMSSCFVSSSSVQEAGVFSGVLLLFIARLHVHFHFVNKVLTFDPFFKMTSLLSAVTSVDALQPTICSVLVKS